MKKVLAFAGSNSSKSINKSLATYASTLLEGVDVEVLDLNDYEMPIYSMDREESDGIPENAKVFVEKIASTDGIILSFAEHNGSYSTAFKNILDWASRHNQKTWADKKLLLMATSPGKRGGASVLNTASQSFPHFGAQVVGTFSLPSFYDHFSDEGIKDDSLKAELMEALEKLSQAL